MFKLVFSKMYDNNIFTKYGLKPVAEDYFRTYKNSFCIGDGVTRDYTNGNPAKYPKTESDVREWIENYPNPSGAYEAAKIVCEEFVDSIKQINEDSINEQTIRELVYKANKKLKTINDNRKIDYLKEDYYCCVAVGGLIVDNYLYCFSIGDCHIKLYDENYNLIFETINNHTQFEQMRDIMFGKKYSWQEPEYRKMVRKEYRNNLNKKYDGQDVSFGVLSGEETAEHYIDTYKVNLDNVKYICAYSDGCEPNFKSKETVKQLLQNPNTLEKEGVERTLIIYEKM